MHLQEVTKMTKYHNDFMLYEDLKELKANNPDVKPFNAPDTVQDNDLVSVTMDINQGITIKNIEKVDDKWVEENL